MRALVALGRTSWRRWQPGAACILLLAAFVVAYLTLPIKADDDDSEAAEVQRQLDQALAARSSLSPALPVLHIARNLTGRGFHLTLSHRIAASSLSSLSSFSSPLSCSPSLLRFLYVIPPTFYLDLDQIANTHRLQPLTSPSAFSSSPLDVEQPAERSAAHQVLLSFPLQAEPRQQADWQGDVTLHLRYQRAREGGGYADAELVLPEAVWYQCEEDARDAVWREVWAEWSEGSAVLHAAVPVGDLRDAELVRWSVLLLSIGGVALFALVLSRYPVQEPRQRQHEQ